MTWPAFFADIDEMPSEARDFIPGACATGPAEPVFAELDKGTHSERLVVLAQEACRSCLQLPHCEEQRKGIAQELGIRGVERTVIGAAEVETPEMVTDENVRPKEPSFTFDLQYPLTEPRHMLEVIRQGFRSGQLPTKGSEAAQHETLSSFLEARLGANLTNEGNPLGLDAAEVRSIAGMAARTALKYHRAMHSDWPRRRQRAPLSEEDMLTAAALQDVFVEDVLALKSAGFKEPEVLAQVHSPNFYDRIIKTYGQSFDIAIGRIRKILRDHALNPIPVIERHITRSRQYKEALPQSKHREQAPVIPLESLPAAARVRELIRQHRGWASYTRFIPEIKDYLWVICRHNLNDPNTQVKQLFHRVRGLQDEYPDIGTPALTHLAYHHQDNAENAIATFNEVLPKLQEQYPDNPALSDKKLERFAYTYLDKAFDEVAGYLDRLAELRATCEAAQLSAPDSFLWAKAEKYKRKLTAEEIRQLLEETQLRRSMEKRLPKLPGIEGWIAGKVSRLYGKERAEEVLTYISRFLKRGHLVVAYVKSRQDILPTSYDNVDNRTGSYLALSDQFQYFSLEEQEAILASFGLDRIVLGYDVNEERLLTYFKTSDLNGLVDDHLLPYTRSIDVNRENPLDILYVLRLRRRDEQMATTGDPQLEEKLDKKLELLLRYLGKSAGDPDLSDASCRYGLRQLLKRVLTTFPTRVSKKTSLLVEVATAYLEDARQIKDLGCNYPYTVALGYDGVFCKNFFASVGNEAWQPSKEYLWRMLQETTTRQATVTLRGYQRLFRHFLPLFKAREIGVSYLRRLYLESPDTVGDRLALYDQAIQVYSPKAMAHTIHHYCFHTDTPDPISEIRAWQRAVADVDSSYKRLLGTPTIKAQAHYKRGEELTAALDNQVRAFHELSAEYARSPHPAVDDEVIKYFVQNLSTLGKQLEAYKQRWELAHAAPDVAEIIAEMDIEVLRRVLMLNRVNPIDAIHAYQQLQESYRHDDYIDSSMIDKALKWGLRQAAISIKNLKLLLQNTDIKFVSLHKDYVLRRGGTRPLHESIGDTKTPAPDARITSSLMDPDAPTREQRRLLTQLHHLSPKDYAAVVAVYQIPWLLPQDMQNDGWAETDKVCEAFNARDTDELRPIVEKIIAKLRN